MDALKELDMISDLEYLQIIADLESETPPPNVPQTEQLPAATAPQETTIAEQWQNDPHGFLQRNLQNNLYYLFGMREESKYLKHRIQKMGKKKYSDNVQQGRKHHSSFPKIQKSG